MSAARGSERARAVSLGLLGTLIVLSIVAVALETRSPAGTVTLGLFLVVPLLLPVAGLLRRTRRVYAWATLCIAPHFVYGLTELVANPAMRGLAATMLFVSLGLAATLIAYLRLTRA